MGERIAVPGTVNFREVTATTSDGLSLRRGRLYRADSLARIGRAGRRHLARLGVRRIIDLRTDFDRRFGGTPSLRGVGAERVSLPLHGGSPAEARAGMTLSSVYRTILGQREQVGAAIRAISSADGPVVVHCTAGKDRTGLVIALTLRAIGVPDEQVLADYTATETHLAGAWEHRMLRRMRRYRRFGIELTDDFRDLLVKSPEQALTSTFDWLDAEHGGVNTYLAASGVDALEIERLRAALLDEVRLDA